MLNSKPIIKITKVLFSYLIISIVFGIISALIWDMSAQIIPNIIIFFIIIIKAKKSNIFKFSNLNLNLNKLLLTVFFSIVNFITYNKILYLIDGFKLDAFPDKIIMFTPHYFIVSLPYLIICVIIEEVIFRRVLLLELNKIFQPTISILFQSIPFGLIHFDSLSHIIVAIFFGIYAGIIHYSTNSLLYCIIFHCLHNFYCDIIVTHYKNYKFLDKFVYQENTLFYICLVLQVIILILFLKSRQKDIF